MKLNLFGRSKEKLHPEKKEKKSLENQKISRKQKDEMPNLGRRAFLKLGAYGAGIAAIKSIPFNNLLEKYGQKEEELEDEGEIIDEKTYEIDMEDDYDELNEEYLPKMEEAEFQSESLRDILSFDQKGDVELSPEKMRSVEKYWENVHSTEGNKLHKSLLDGYYDIGEYEPELRRIFSEAGVPEKYIYLALAESYWDLDAVSPVKARGPYQFMKATAREYGLYDDKKKVDYRNDPLKSAKAAAQLLSDLYKASGDWDLALSGYNGGHIWRYLRQCRDKKEEVSYTGFLTYIEGKINNIRNELKYSESFDHVIRSPLGSIARRYGQSVSRLAEYNNIEDSNKVRRGQVIKIPLDSEEIKERLYERKTAGFRENLNYPARFKGIYETIEKGVVDEQKKPQDHSMRLALNIYPGAERKMEKEAYFEYTVKPGEGWFRVYKNVEKLTEASKQEIINLNSDLAERGLHPGDKIRIPKKGFG